MKQVVLDYKKGRVFVADVPVPTCKPDGLLVANVCSVMSVGTERSSVRGAQSSLLAKARQRPDQVRQVLQTLRQEGPLATYEKVLTRLDTLAPMGYCSTGVVIAVGRNVRHAKEGDNVVCAGEGFGSHAQVVSVPRLLCHTVPDGVAFDQAAFAPLGAIALQAVRQAHVSLGDRVVVIGLGLIGLLAVQILHAAGCSVFGTDTNASRCELAKTMGASQVAVTGDPTVPDQVLQFSDGYGADAVLVMASTSSKEPLIEAGAFCREHGRVVVAGAVPTEFPRKEYWEKELSLSMSRSFGPGYYDPKYAVHGEDYPFGYVRWTAGRNIQEVLTLMARGDVLTDRLVTHRFATEHAEQAYALVSSDASSVLGIVFDHERASDSHHSSSRAVASPRSNAADGLRIGWIGAGNFARASLIPAFRNAPGVSLEIVSNLSGVSAYDVSRKFGFARATCNADDILNAPEVNCIVITTRHDLHADLAVKALRAGKHVFLEKPIALTIEDLGRVVAAARSSHGSILVGFNRRYAPLVVWLRRHFKAGGEPLMMQYRVNAGPVPAGHWVRDAAQGGGRLVGEVCHFVDLCHHLADSPPVSVFCQALPGLGGIGSEDDNVQLQVRFGNGSLAQISYTAGGDPAFPRERLEVVGQGAVAVMDNFRSAVVSRGSKRSTKKFWVADRGYADEVNSFVRSLQDGQPLSVSFDSSVLSMLATLEAVESLRTGQPVQIDPQAVSS